ncbi:fimbrial protein [Citrobacter braakii]|nr:fimbrial protein [Citrobacter braakii]
MKRVTLLLLTASLLPSCVLAWNTPGENFSGELKLGGPVTSNVNPWVWKIGERNDGLNVTYEPATRSGEQAIQVSLPASTILLGKTVLTTPAGREGLTPRVTYGKNINGFKLEWSAPGIADVMLPVMGNEHVLTGHLTFRIQAAAVLRHVVNDNPVYAGIYDDLKGNGLPGRAQVMIAEQTQGKLQAMFNGEEPAWLQEMTLSKTISLSRFSDASLKQVDGVYGAQVVAGRAELFLNGEIPSHWSVSLPISIEYQ